MVAMITILFGFVHTTTYQRFEKKGYLSVLLWLYLLTVIVLVITACLSLFGFSNQPFPVMLHVLIGLFINSLTMVIIAVVITINVARRVGNTPAPPD